nr:HD domain-containing phosphohydrolase [Sporolactobacillus pectinivorans]
MLGCLLHDIGKLCIPRSILLKKSKLTEREYIRITRHAADGFALLEKLGFPKETCRIVRSHHERMDGSGYPDKMILCEKDSDLIFMMIADVYSALTLKRSYRDPMHATKALQNILSSCIHPQHFDLQTSFSFINFLHIYPPATQVLLSNNKMGTVIANPNGADILPKVRLQITDRVIQLPSDLSVTIKKVSGWDNSHVEIQQRQAWKDFIGFIIDGNPLKAMKYMDHLSDGKRIEDIFIDLFEKAQDEIRSDFRAAHYHRSDLLIATTTLMRLLSWKMLRIARDLDPVMGKIVVADLNAENEFLQMRMVNDLLKINGWKTYYLSDHAEIDMITELIHRKDAKYLAVSLYDRHHAFSIRNMLIQLRSDFPDLTVFIHGEQAHLVSDSAAQWLLTSSNLTEFIRNLRYCFPIESTADKEF